MDLKYDKVTKFCSFYVSDWHLTTMLLPYINKKIDEEVQIATILENELQENVEVLVKKLNIKNKEKILDINWNNKSTNRISNINKILDNNKKDELIIIVNGKKEFIDKSNMNIQKAIQQHIDDIRKNNTKIKIVDCYNILEFNENIVEILDGHDKLLNTSGEKEITDVFEDYIRDNNIKEIKKEENIDNLDNIENIDKINQVDEIDKINKIG